MNPAESDIIICEFCNIPAKHEVSGFYKCPRCGNLYNSGYKTTAYEGDYFEDEYKKQYGLSYIDDKKNIQKKMFTRLNHIKKYMNQTEGKRLLEIGSAAGFFLEIASDSGFLSQGWEISAYMSEYANKQGNKTTQGNFLDLLDNEKTGNFDLVCAFYSIEHFQCQKKIWQGLSRLLNKGGLLALTVPSYFGPVYYFQKEQWIKTHPVDHFVDYSPSGIKKVCSLFGFKLLQAFPDAYHPERFIFGRSIIFRKFYTMLQKKLVFSDTIFLILQKTI